MFGMSEMMYCDFILEEPDSNTRTVKKVWGKSYSHSVKVKARNGVPAANSHRNSFPIGRIIVDRESKMENYLTNFLGSFFILSISDCIEFQTDLFDSTLNIILDDSTLFSALFASSAPPLLCKSKSDC